MIRIFCILFTAHDIRFQITPRQARNPKPLGFVFERVARGTNLDKLWIILRFYTSIIKICYNSFLPDKLWEHTKTQNSVLWRWIDHACFVKLSLTLKNKQSAADAKPYLANGFIAIWAIYRLCGAHTADKTDVTLLRLKNSNSFLAMEKKIKHYSWLLQYWRSSSPTSYTYIQTYIYMCVCVWPGHNCEM
jgi:hypothetical protein